MRSVLFFDGFTVTWMCTANLDEEGVNGKWRGVKELRKYVKMRRGVLKDDGEAINGNGEALNGDWKLFYDDERVFKGYDKAL